MSNKKGFTLIELIAVIIILAIIALISTPIILNVVEDTKKSAGQSEANMVLKGITDYCEQEKIGMVKTDYCKDSKKINDNLDKIVNLGKLEKKDIEVSVKDGNVENLILRSNGNNYIKNNDMMVDMSILNETPKSCFTILNEDNEIIIKKYNKICGSNVIIPNGVTKIANFSFGRKNLSKIKFPKTLKYIGDMSFYDNNIDNIDLLDSVNYIGEYAFSENHINELKIPKNLTIISTGSFSKNHITKIDIPLNIVEIKSDAFANNLISKLQITNENLVIGLGAFNSNKIKELELPNKIKKLDGGAFSNNLLDDKHAFVYGRNSDGTINENIINSYAGANKDEIIIPDNITKIENQAFMNAGINKVTFNDKIKEIGAHAFFNNNLVELMIPKTLNELSFSVFGKNNIKKLVIPDNIKKIGTSAFINNKLESVEISEGVTNIDYYAFMGNNLQEVIIPSTVEIINSGAFNKNENGNIKLLKIFNKTGRMFDWYTITDESLSSHEKFEIGEVKNKYGNIIISK